MNSVILIGRLTRDPELTYTPNNQTAVTHLALQLIDLERRVVTDRLILSESLFSVSRLRTVTDI